MSTLVFDSELALEADGAGFIKFGGVYNGSILSCKAFGSKVSNSRGVEFSLESSGSIANYVKVYTIRKNGERIFGYNKIMALMGLFGMSSVETHRGNDGEDYIKGFCDKPISFKLQRKDYYKTEGGIGFKMELIGFFDSNSSKSYKEKVENLPAKNIEIVYEDELLKKNESSQQPNGARAYETAGKNGANDEDLPF